VVLKSDQGEIQTRVAVKEEDQGQVHVVWRRDQGSGRVVDGSARGELSIVLLLNCVRNTIYTRKGARRHLFHSYGCEHIRALLFITSTSPSFYEHNR
jgi:hypothetical protein